MTKAPKTLNLSAGVSDDQFRAAVTALWGACREVRSSRGWCGDWMPHVRRITRLFPAEDGDISFPPDLIDTSWLTPEGLAAYQERKAHANAAELLLMRGRVLSFVSSNNITLQEAHQVLRAAGLPLTDHGILYTVRLRVKVTGNFTSERQLRTALAGLATDGVETEQVSNVAYDSDGTISAGELAELLPFEERY